MSSDESPFISTKSNAAPNVKSDNHSPNKEEKQANNEKNILSDLRGYLFGFISAFAFCLVPIIVKYTKQLSGSDNSLIRYTITMIIMISVSSYKKTELFGPKKQLKWLLLRGFIGLNWKNTFLNITIWSELNFRIFKGSFAIITIYFAIKFIDPSDIIILEHTGLIITAILSRIFLKEKLTIAHIFAIILTIIGTIFVTKPSFLFSIEDLAVYDYSNLSEYLSNSSSNSTILNLGNNQNNYYFVIGIILTFVGTFSTSCIFLILRKLNNSNVHWTTNTFYGSLFGLPVSLVISVILYLGEINKIDFSDKKSLLIDLICSSIGGVFSSIGQIFLNLSLKYEDPTKISIIKASDIFISIFLQYVFLNIKIDLYSLIGGFIILTAVTLVLLFKIVEKRYNSAIKTKSTSIETTDEANTYSEDNRGIVSKIIFFKF